MRVFYFGTVHLKKEEVKPGSLLKGTDLEPTKLLSRAGVLPIKPVIAQAVPH
jgi:hypothetical protein